MIQPLVLGHTAMIPTIVVRAPPASAPLSAARPLLLGASHPHSLLAARDAGDSVQGARLRPQQGPGDGPREADVCWRRVSRRGVVRTEETWGAGRERRGAASRVEHYGGCSGMETSCKTARRPPPPPLVRRGAPARRTSPNPQNRELVRRDGTPAARTSAGVRARSATRRAPGLVR